MRCPRTLYLLSLTVFVLLLTSLAHADFQAGKDAYDQRDYETAFKEWQSLAEESEALAQYNLGVMYDKGQGVPQDDGQAADWYRRAAAQGDAGAQSQLGGLYSLGQGVPQDYAQAREWFLKAAEQGNADAQFSLGLFYTQGWGVPQDYVQAHMWLNLAAAQGNKDAETSRDRVAKGLTSQQIAEAQRLAREWLAQHQK
jgi:TPR repeat protein